MHNDDDIKPELRSRQHEVSSVLTARAAPIDLGRLAAIEDSKLEPGFVLWERFCVTDLPRQTGISLIVAVTDLERDPKRTLGDERQLELHRLPAPSPSERPRWLRGLNARSRVQARVRAYASLEDGSVAVLADPAAGTLILDGDPRASFRLEGRPLLVFAYELATLLSALHQLGAHGVSFALDRLRVSDGHYHVDGFTHLQVQDEGRDLEALVELIQTAGGDAATPLLTPPPTSAMDLQRRLQNSAGDIEDFPTEPPFVGRANELSKLNEGFNQAQIAKQTVVVVRGPRGVGKSRLLREFVAQRVKANDALVLTGARDSRSADTRGGLLGALDQLPRVMSRLNEDERDDIRLRINHASRGVGAIVARSAPSLGAVLRRVEALPPLELGEDFTRHTAVIAELVRALGTRKRPLVLVLDNLEAANSSALAVLKILSEVSPAHHSLIVLGVRMDEDIHEPPGLDAQDLELAPLQIDDVIDLLAQILPGDVENLESLAEALLSGTDGTPLGIWACLQTWLDRGQLTHSINSGVWRFRGVVDGASEREPDIQSLFGPRLAAASAALREFSLHVAVLGAEIGQDELRDLCERLKLDVDALSAELIGLGLLIRARNGLRFPHSSIREFVLEFFSESERRATHDRIAKMLTEQQAPVAQIAYHRDLAFDPTATDPALADRLSRLHVEAGRERLTVYDLERARWHLERALDHSRDSGQRRVAAEGLADICLLLKDIDTAVSLYTAIIATSDDLQSLQVAGKVAQYLFFQSAFTEGRQLGVMAFEQVGEPAATGRLEQIALFVSSVVRSWFGPPKLDRATRDALLRLHFFLAQMCFIDEPLGVLAHVARARLLAKELETPTASMCISLEAFMWGAVGRYAHANKLFAHAVDITTTKSKDIWSEGYARHNWALNLFASNRYENAQDMSDDAIGALREAGDVSATAITIMFKAHYGRDRETAERVLRWCDEAISTSLRNGKTLCLISLECVKLHIFARQGRSGLKKHLTQATELIEQEDTAIERLIGRIHLAFAAFECSEWELGAIQVRKAIAEFAEGPGVPEFCQDFFLVAPLILMELPDRTQVDRKLLRSTLRKFRGFAKRSPRLRHYQDFLDLKLAIKARDNKKVRRTAARIVADVGVHENLYMAHHAHRSLSVLLKGDAVLEAAEHERMARVYGRRLGLGDFVLSALVEVQNELRELGVEAGSRLLDSQISLPGAGMLSPIDTAEMRPALSGPTTEETDVLEAWALTRTHSATTSLGAVLDPVRGATSGSIQEHQLELVCPEPEATVAIEPGELQILIINMLLACQDSLDPNATYSVTLRRQEVELGSNVGRVERTDPGHYLSIRVTGMGITVQSSLLASFSTCDNLARGLGGQLNASTDKTSVSLLAMIPTGAADTVAARPAGLPPCLIIHPDTGVRERLGAALEQLGAPWRAFDPHEFTPANINRARIILADGESLDELVVLGPLLDAELIELVHEGAEPMFHDQPRLRLPVVASELNALLRGS